MQGGKNKRPRMIKCWKGHQSEAETQSPRFFLKYKNGKNTNTCIQCTPYQGDSHWCQTGQHYDGESRPTTLWSQADRLRSSHSQVTGQEIQTGSITIYVRQIICFNILEGTNSLLFLQWRSSCVLPPCNVFSCKHPVMFLFHIQVSRSFFGWWI